MLTDGEPRSPEMSALDWQPAGVRSNQVVVNFSRSVPLICNTALLNEGGTLASP
jgi:hypothetical protein